MPSAVASFEGTHGIPMIDHHSLDKPHRSRAAAARAVNECRVATLRGDCVQKFIDRRGIGRGGIEGEWRSIRYQRLSRQRLLLRCPRRPRWAPAN